MHRITLGTAESHYDVIVRFRRQICAELGFDPVGPSIEPLPYAAYIFGHVQGQSAPLGMGEIYCYDQAYRSHADSPYALATDLSKIAPLHELCHIRSVALSEPHRMSRLFAYLCVGLAHVAAKWGTRHATAATSIENGAILKLHRGAGMKALGTFKTEGIPCQLSLLDVRSVLNRAGRLPSSQFLQIDDALLSEIRRRRGDAFEPAICPSYPHLDAHFATTRF